MGVGARNNFLAKMNFFVAKKAMPESKKLYLYASIKNWTNPTAMVIVTTVHCTLLLVPVLVAVI